MIDINDYSFYNEDYWDRKLRKDDIGVCDICGNDIYGNADYIYSELLHNYVHEQCLKNLFWENIKGYMRKSSAGRKKYIPSKFYFSRGVRYGQINN